MAGDDGFFGAVVCENGHCFNIVLDTGQAADPRCIECGAKNLTNCLQCEAKIRGLRHRGVVTGAAFDQNFRNNCWSCGNAYPWREKRIAEVARLLALNFDIEDWDEGTKERLRGISGEIVSGSASADLVIQTGRWLQRMGGDAARQLLWEVVKIAGAETLIAGVKGALGH